MDVEFANAAIEKAVFLMISYFGEPIRETKKALAWNIRPDLGLVIEIDQPKARKAVNIWMPNPSDGSPLPELALEYSGETGRHSNTYPSPGLGKGSPALKFIVQSETELQATAEYAKAMSKSMPLPEVNSDIEEPGEPVIVDVASMPRAKKVAPRRQAIPRAIQREVWQRDGGECVECGTRALLCFDHIVPFSKGGSNTVRNLQLLCEKCNLSKGNRI